MKLALHFFTFILDILFPKSELVRFIEKMSPDDLYISAQKNIESSTISSIFSYKDPYIQAGLWEIKYRKNVIIAKKFAKLLQDLIFEDIEQIPQNAILIPIPLSAKRYNERGYNQAELLITHMDLPFEKQYAVLMRTAHTIPQTKLKRSKRLTNLKNCFKVIDQEKITGKTILLIDDVSTTGATMKEAETTLYKAGAKKVLMYTIAH